MKRISILGSTGSIGTQALDIISNNPDRFSVCALSCASRVMELKEQIRKFSPEAVCVAEENDAADLQKEFPGLDVYHGKAGLAAIASMPCDLVLNSLMGMRGLEPTLAALSAGRDIAFANKETLVAGGHLVIRCAKDHGAALLPVDSEHSAIFQCLQGAAGNPVRNILLTASGGPFRGFTKEQLRNVTLKQALKHPNWNMGAKITVDSASMMNKGLEVIEARWLFDVPLDRIRIVVHPQSVLHSAVEFEDGSVIGQLGNPDMRVPIAYAFSYPERIPMSGDMTGLDLFSLTGGLTFYPPDREVFWTIDLAYEASRQGGSCPVCLNSANEALAAAFLQERIRFHMIQELLEEIMEEHEMIHDPDLETILEVDRRTRAVVEEKIREL